MKQKNSYKPFSRWVRSSRAEETSSAAATVHNEKEEGEAPSLWLYGAGLLVTLCGLYAVNFGLSDSWFASVTFGLATAGYGISYRLRALGRSKRNIPLPAMGAIAFLVIVLAFSDHGLGVFAPQDMGEDRAKGLQLFIAWIAIIQSYFIGSNSTVLFVCVPCLTMIALVSTTNPDQHITYAFLVFVASATFLMIHENYLRTRAAMPDRRALTLRNGMFGGQLLLAAGCIGLAFLLANFVVVPIQSIGQAVFLPGSLVPISSPSSISRNDNFLTALKDEPQVDLAQGPQTESNQTLLRIVCNRELYWRGTTFDFYTGRSFQNKQNNSVQSNVVDQSSNESRSFELTATGQHQSKSPWFYVPESRLEGNSEARNRVLVRQDVQVVNGSYQLLYGADAMKKVQVNREGISATNAEREGINTTDAGSVKPPYSLLPGDNYSVQSWVPIATPDQLRAASSSREDVPTLIQKLYLQVYSLEGDISDLNDKAHEITQGLTNNYDKAQAIRNYIARTCQYNLQAARVPDGKDVVQDFLFNSHQGYCDSFGAAMTLLCRCVKIPARLCSGFITGERGADGAFVVRQKHRHIWTEVYFPKFGWVDFDATGGSEDISDHSNVTPKKAKGFFAWLVGQGRVPSIIGLVCLTLLGYVLKIEIWDRLVRSPLARKDEKPGRAGRNGEILQLYYKATLLMAKQGIHRAPSATLDEFAAEIRQKTQGSLPDLGRAWEKLTTQCKLFAYSPLAAQETDVAEAREMVAEIRTILSSTKKTLLKPASSEVL